MDYSDQIDTFNRYTQVSRETILSLKKYEEILIKSNKNLNLIGKSTEKEIWIRHFLDSAQIIDFIDKNENKIIDLGSGAGFPGLILSILLKDKKIPLKVYLIEKSPKKANFLTNVIKELNLNSTVLNINVLNSRFNYKDSTIVARAFKPLEEIFQIIEEKGKNFKKIILFLGKKGKNKLLQASKKWDLKYKQSMSITSNDSIILKIEKLNKKVE